jgi:cation diffusion facilitator family transporter
MNNEVEKIKRLKQGQRIAWIASLLTLLLAIVKGAVGYHFDSPLLVADAFHSAGDVVTIAASGFGLWLAAREKTEKFPYGLYKAETLAGLFIGALVLWAGVEMAREGYSKLLHGSTAPGFPVLPVIATILSIIINYFLAKKEKEVGKVINSQSLQIKAYDTLLDIYVSCAVLIGLLLAFLGIPYAEGGLIMAISLLILKLGVQTVWICLLSLLDANLDPELQAEIVGKVAGINGVMGVPQVRVRRSGPFRMVDCTIGSSPNLPLYRAHELADKIEDAVTGGYKDIETVFVHVEPSREKVLSALIPVAEVNGLESRIHEHFGRAPYFVIVRLAENDIEIVDFYYNEFLDEKIHIGVKIIKALIHSGLSMLFARGIGELSFYMLKENFIDIYRVVEELTVREIVQAYRENRLSRLTTPTHSLEESETVTHEPGETKKVGP